MNCKELNKAREYEIISEERIPNEERAYFHLTPRTGWMNDPNGFSYYGGKYHLFYQYYPYDTSWGPMHWGHACTEDFIKWEHLPAALAPDQDYDANGCWSGSGISLKDGRHALIYTGMLENKQTGEVKQTQCLAIGDGIDYTKFDNNPVIDETMLPKGASKEDFRDPKVWYDEEEQQYYLVVGNRTEDGSGAVLLFQSEDMKNWKYTTTLDRSNNEYGKMWECPDFFSLGDTHVLLVSPQEMRAKGREFHNGNNSMCILGNYDNSTHKFIRKSIQSVDQGLDFYAPQTLEATDGRRIMIGWMQSWESCRNQPHGNHFFGTMSVPRELSIENGKILQWPVRELENYRANHVNYNDVIFKDEMQLYGIKGRVLDMVIDLDMPLATAEDVVSIKLARDEENETLIQYNPQSGLLRFDRSNCGFNCDIVNVREVDTTPHNLKLRILLDRYSVEIFVNQGERVLTSTFYTPDLATEIAFAATSETRMTIDKWDIVGC